MRTLPETFNRQDWPRLVAQAVNRLSANFEETNEPFIRVTSGADQSLPTGVLTILDYDTTETNNATGTFSVSTDGRVTVAETGIYDISTGVVIEASAIDALSAASLGIFVNGNLIAVDTAETTLGVSQSRGQSIATQIALTAGDIVDARVRATTVSGVGNGLARRTAVLLGSTATQVNHLSIAKCASVTASSGGALVAGSGITITPNDGADTITIAADIATIKPTESIIIAASDETTALTTGTAKVTFRMPYAFTLSAVRASVTTAPTGSVLTVDINEGGVSILSTNLTIDATEKTSTTAATPAVISDSSLADDAEITIDIDTVGSTIAGAGLKVVLIGSRT